MAAQKMQGAKSALPCAAINRVPGFRKFRVANSAGLGIDSRAFPC